jgi:hypothetical protein
MALRPFMAELLAGRIEREHRAMHTDEARARAYIYGVHRGEPLKSLRLDRPEKAIGPQETIEMWLERIKREDAA